MICDIKETIIEVVQAVFPLTLAILLLMLTLVGTSLNQLASFF